LIIKSLIYGDSFLFIRVSKALLSDCSFTLDSSLMRFNGVALPSNAPDVQSGDFYTL